MGSRLLAPGRPGRLHTPPPAGRPARQPSTPISGSRWGAAVPTFPTRALGQTGPDGPNGLTGSRAKNQTNSCMTDCRPSWIHHLAILVIWRGLAPPTPAHRLMTLYPPPEIVTYHLDKLSAPTESHGLLLSCCLGCTRGLSKLPDCCQASDRQAAMSPKHPGHPPCLPLDNKHHPILSLPLPMSVLFWPAVHCVCFSPSVPARVICWARRQHYQIPPVKLSKAQIVAW